MVPLWRENKVLNSCFCMVDLKLIARMQSSWQLKSRSRWWFYSPIILSSQPQTKIGECKEPTIGKKLNEVRKHGRTVHVLHVLPEVSTVGGKWNGAIRESSSIRMSHIFGISSSLGLQLQYDMTIFFLVSQQTNKMRIHTSYYDDICRKIITQYNPLSYVLSSCETLTPI